MKNWVIKTNIILILLIGVVFFAGCAHIEKLSPKEMAFSKAVKLYGDDNPLKRVQALDYFYKSEKPEAKEYLKQATMDKDVSVRLKAIDTVVKAYGLNSSEILFEKIFDKDSTVKNKAEKYIKLYKKSLNPLILKKLDNAASINDQIKAIRVIKVLEDNSYIGYLGNLLFTDANIYVKLEAIKTLSHFDNEIAQDYVVKSLEANDYSRLIVLGLESVPRDGSFDTIEIVMPHLSSIKYQVLVAAIKVLKENNNKNAVEPIFMMLDKTHLINNKEIIDESISALSALGGPETLDLFLKALDSDREKVRYISVKAAIKSKESPWADEVINKALNNDQKDVQIAAMFAVKEHQSKQSVIDLVNLLDDENPLIRESAIEAISRIKNAVNYDYVFKNALKDPDYLVVLATVRSLGNVKSDWAVTLLNDIISSEENTDIKVIAINSITSFGSDPGVVKLLKAQLSSSNAKVADSASFALAKIRSTSSKQVLLDSLNSDSSDVKIRAINALQLLGDPSVISKLQKCTKDVDPRVRKQAKLTLNFLVNTQEIRRIRNRGLK